MMQNPSSLKIHIQPQIHLNSPVLRYVLAWERCRTFVGCGFGGGRRNRWTPLLLLVCCFQAGLLWVQFVSLPVLSLPPMPLVFPAPFDENQVRFL
jgi:hypothetical protein